MKAVVHAEWNVQTQDSDEFRAECVTILHVPEDNLNEYKMDNFPNDEKTQCYVKCMMGKLRLFDERTGFNVERLVLQLGQDKREIDTKATIENCADQNTPKTDACEWAYRGFYCIRQAEFTFHL